MKDNAKEPLEDAQPQTVEEWGMPYCANPCIPTRYSGLQRPKHQCHRKSKPKRRGVKHGNRKKKK